MGSHILPMMASFSSLIYFKIDKTEQNSSCVVAEVVPKNFATLVIKPIYKSIFMKEL